MLFKARAMHLMETEPQLTWKKFQKNRAKLYQEVNDRAVEALRYKAQLQDRNLPPGALDELALNYVAPADVPLAKNQLPEEQQMQIWEWANDPPESRAATT